MRIVDRAASFIRTLKGGACLQAFLRNACGGVSIILSLSAPAILGLGGVAIDYAALSSQQSRLRGATDGAALAVGREMTLVKLSDQQLQAVAQNYVTTNLGASVPQGIAVKAAYGGDGLTVKVSVDAPLVTPLGLIGKLTGLSAISTSATARVGQQTKLCLLSISEIPVAGFALKLVANSVGIDLMRNARITANGCVMHTNLTGKEAVKIESGSVAKADLICSAGGVKNTGGTVQGDVVTNCPQVKNPLADRSYGGNINKCTANGNLSYKSGDIILKPGVYCGKVEVAGTAKVRLEPGIYAFRESLIVKDNAEFTGTRVGLYFFGTDSFFRFLDNALLDLSAPETGTMAGILIWEGLDALIVEAKKSTISPSFHQIKTERARRLTGTIYLPAGRLLIDSKRAVAQQSEYTVLVVNRLDLADGPNLVLNSNYAATNIPVPTGLGPIGARNVRLEN